MVAKVDPKATVITRSKAFSLATVRFPATRTMATSEMYDSPPAATARAMSNQSSNSMPFPTVPRSIGKPAAGPAGIGAPEPGRGRFRPPVVSARPLRGAGDTCGAGLCIWDG